MLFHATAPMFTGRRSDWIVTMSRAPTPDSELRLETTCDVRMRAGMHRVAANGGVKFSVEGQHAVA